MIVNVWESDFEENNPVMINSWDEDLDTYDTKPLQIKLLEMYNNNEFTVDHDEPEYDDDGKTIISWTNVLRFDIPDQEFNNLIGE